MSQNIFFFQKIKPKVICVSINGHTSLYHNTKTIVDDYDFKFFKKVKTVFSEFSFTVNVKTIIINYGFKK